jgi:Uma2 family endonuclease
MATTAFQPATEADLLAMPADGYRYELVDGEIRRMSPAGGRHGDTGAQLIAQLVAFVKAHRLGRVFTPDTGFRLPNGNVRSPDVSFVAAGRFEDEKPPVGYIPFAPDLAVEVLSPGDSSRDVLEKVGEYLDAGVRLVWVIDPEKRSASRYRSLLDVRTLDINGLLDGEDVVSGFRCRLSEIV